MITERPGSYFAEALLLFLYDHRIFAARILLLQSDGFGPVRKYQNEFIVSISFI